MQAGETALASATAPGEEAKRATAVPPWSHVLLVVAGGALDIVATAVAFGSQQPHSAAVALHGAAVVLAGLPAVLHRSTPADKTLPILAAIAIAAVGPIGALGALVTAMLAPARPRATPLLEAWYRRIAHSVETDPVSQLSDMVTIGRSVSLTGDPPASFARVMTHGSLSDRQALLGQVARRFDVAYLPALKIALTNPEPVIRVQAAAVATKVQHELSRIVSTWDRRTAEAMNATEALAATVELEACLASGLIEAADRTRAEAALHRARAQASSLTGEPRFASRLLSSRTDRHQLVAAAGYERLLVRERRFRELRNWRRLQPAGLHPDWRLRPRARRARAKAVAAPAAMGPQR